MDTNNKPFYLWVKNFEHDFILFYNNIKDKMNLS